MRHFQGVQDARANRERVHHRAVAAALLHRVQRALGQQALGDVVSLREGAAQRQGKHARLQEEMLISISERALLKRKT